MYNIIIIIPKLKFCKVLEKNNLIPISINNYKID